MIVTEERTVKCQGNLQDSNCKEMQWNLIYVRKEAKTGGGGCWIVDMWWDQWIRVRKRDKKCKSEGPAIMSELEEWKAEVKEQDFKIEISSNDMVCGVTVE